MSNDVLPLLFRVRLVRFVFCRVSSFVQTRGIVFRHYYPVLSSMISTVLQEVSEHLKGRDSTPRLILPQGESCVR